MEHHIHTVYKIKKEPCGIDLFDRKLRMGITKLGIATSTSDLESNACDSSSIIIFHYIPALYANSKKGFENFFTKTNAIKIVIVHGVFPNDSFQQLADTVCPHMKCQLQTIKDYSSIIISLSEGATKNLISWNFSISKNRIYTLYHPGLDKNLAIPHSSKESSYVFLGGITRAKKNFLSPQYLQLFESLKNSGIKVWLHSTPNIHFDTMLPVWKFTTNELKWKLWSDTISKAKWVLCPYNTKVQTVSGLISESISVGTMVLSTSFPYALEMSQKYKDYIFINDNLENWPKIILADYKKVNPPNYPTWEHFTQDLINLIHLQMKCF